jgi:hypothetical protein
MISAKATSILNLLQDRQDIALFISKFEMEIFISSFTQSFGRLKKMTEGIVWSTSGERQVTNEPSSRGIILTYGKALEQLC